MGCIWCQQLRLSLAGAWHVGGGAGRPLLRILRRPPPAAARAPRHPPPTTTNGRCFVMLA
ncbi:hypothetical protein GS504_00920 [Rhodococcus hoagii]|nr:hypothetical protein [Prescottella equi]NKS72196.1 hypothetical protein [Prescottella equi]